LFSYLSKLNKEIQANQGHQGKGGNNTNFPNQIFPIYCFLSHIYIWIALPSWFYLVLVSVSQEPQEGEMRGVSV
jgi:hypothetical protein